jgi:Leucine-rich repeat (LRR) protein
MKPILTTFIFSLLAFNLLAQDGYKKMLAECDSLYNAGVYIKAYQSYTLLYRDYEKEKDSLRPRLLRTREAIDRMKADMQTTIAAANQRQRNYELACVEYAVLQEKQRWLEQNRDKNENDFRIYEHTHELNLSGFGLVQLPELIGYFRNLAKIDISDNFLLDSTQAYSILNRLNSLKDIKTGRMQIIRTDTIDFVAKIQADLQKISSNQKQYPKNVQDILAESYQHFTKGEYAISLGKYELITDIFPKYKTQMEKYEDLVAQAIEQTMLELDAAQLQSLQIQRNTDIVTFDRAARNINPQFTTCRNFNDKDFLDIDSLSFKDFRMTEFTNQFVPKCQNLKHINLLGNPNIDWVVADNIINKLVIHPELYISIYELHSFPIQHRHMITGLEILKTEMSEIPENILILNQLKYLSVSGNKSFTNNFADLPNKLFELSNLKQLILSSCNILHLPQEIGNLRNLELLDLRFNHIDTIPSEIGCLKNLKILDLSENRLSSLPPGIGALNNLTELNLMENYFKKLPPEISKLNRLLKLNLGYNGFYVFPLEILKLCNLIELNLSGNPLSQIPIEIGQLSNLMILNFWWNELSTLPTEIGQLSKLTNLILGNNKINNIPPEIKLLQNLTELDLSHNKFTKLPDEIEQLKSLTELNLSENKLTSIPTEVFKIKSLIVLNLGKNLLSELPTDISNLNNLTQLDLSDNQFIRIPTEIQKISKLTDLDLSNNEISSIDEEINLLGNLMKLNLAGNQLSILPTQINILNRLKVLNLSRNQLVSLPNEIGELKNLTQLDLSGNQLATIPSEIGKLIYLSELALYGNQLNSLPNTIGNLYNLFMLILSDNKLKSLPSEIGLMTNLTNLFLNENQLSKLPPEIGNLKKLEQLDLSKNLINKPPPEIGNMTSLIHLNLSENQLSELPSEIGNLNKLIDFDLKSNRLLKLPAEIGKLYPLVKLDLSENQLNELPADIGNLKNLTIFDLSDNILKSVPSEIGMLSNLNEFYLTNNQLNTIPVDIGKLSNLVHFDLSKNNNLNITSICTAFQHYTKKIFITSHENIHNSFKANLFIILPKFDLVYPEFGDISNLAELDISNNININIASVGNSFKNSKKKLVITCERFQSNNDTTKIYIVLPSLNSLPLEIGHIHNLIELDLINNWEIDIKSVCLAFENYSKDIIINTSTNTTNSDTTKLLINLPKLKTLPPEIGKLNKLIELNLASNQLTALPSEIGNLTYLTNLNIERNHISFLPPEIGKLTNLKWLNLSNNKLTTLPPEIFVLENISADNWSIIGQQLYFKKNYEQAVLCYLKSIEKDNTSNNSAAFGNAGFCYRLLGNNEKALKYLNEYLTFNENNIWTLNQLSITYYALKQYEHAYEITSKLIQLEPKNYSHWFSHSFYCLFVGKYKDAIQSAKKSLELEPSQSGVITNLVLGYVLNNQLDKAEPLYKEWKDKKFLNDDRYAKEVFIKDIEDLEKAGITHPDFEKIRKLMQE